MLGIGVPGTVAGLALAHEKYGSGKFSLTEMVAPAIGLARDGIPVEDDTEDSLPSVARISRWPASAKIFLQRDGTPLGEGDTLVQADLAATLEAIAEKGPARILRRRAPKSWRRPIRDAGGIMTTDDLKSYRP